MARLCGDPEGRDYRGLRRGRADRSGSPDVPRHFAESRVDGVYRIPSFGRKRALPQSPDATSE